MENMFLILVLIFAGFGILNTMYLSWHSITKKPVKCIFFPPEWCQKVQYSSYSKTFGIPNSFLGFGMYVFIFVLTLFSKADLLPFWPAAALVFFGFLFSMYFVYVQAAILRAFCTWCVLSAIEFAALLVVTLILLFGF